MDAFFKPKPRRTNKRNRRLAWSVSYGDLTTLLMVFFVLLLSAAKVDFHKLARIQDSLTGDSRRHTPLSQVMDDLTKTLAQNGLARDVDVVRDDMSVVLMVKDQLLFESGSAHISPESHAKVLPLFKALGQLPQSYRIAIEGHTDDIPIVNSLYPSNWHLSVARALSVHSLALKTGLWEGQLSIHGYADTQPLHKNRDETGRAIPHHQRRNRRVAIRIN